MQTIGKTRFWLALLGVVFLLANPAGICAGTPGIQSPSHPCCPAPTTPQHTPATSSCVCIDRPSTAPSLPSLADQGPVVDIAPEASTLAVVVPERDFVQSDTPVAVPQDLSVSFCQLLL
jgi:hypothetical protein